MTVGALQAALVAAGVSTLAWQAGALRRSGAVAAALVGTLILMGGGWLGGAVLMSFFLPSSAISRLWPGTADQSDPKGDRRDGWQVLANGGLPALVLAFGFPSSSLAFAAGLACAAADTWATAVGAHSRRPPRHILTGQVVPRGTSGGVSLFGTAGAALGAAFVAAAALPMVGGRGAMLTFGIGMGGMLIDSVLGGSVQGRFHCDRCDRPSEWGVHRCGATTRFLGGWRWMTNDGVNALAILAATAAGWAAWPS